MATVAEGEEPEGDGQEGQPVSRRDLCIKLTSITKCKLKPRVPLRDQKLIKVRIKEHFCVVPISDQQTTVNMNKTSSY